MEITQKKGDEWDIPISIDMEIETWGQQIQWKPHTCNSNCMRKI